MERSLLSGSPSFSRQSFSSRTLGDLSTAEKLERPLTEEFVHELSRPKNGVQDPASVAFYAQSKGNFYLPVTHALAHKQRTTSLWSYLIRGM
ncbi:hypothetical protein V2J09_017776 [Rumex salicifolius]